MIHKQEYTNCIYERNPLALLRSTTGIGFCGFVCSNVRGNQLKHMKIEFDVMHCELFLETPCLEELRTLYMHRC